jgi:hypothetical protein
MTCATEHEEAKALVQAVRLNEARHPELRMLFAVPNGGDRHKATAAKLKAEGVKAGVLDYILPVARGGFHGLAIELKRRKRGQTSGEQEQWIEAFRQQGWRAEVCKGWIQALAVLADYLGVRLAGSESADQSAIGQSQSPKSGRRSLPRTQRSRPGSAGESQNSGTRGWNW